MKSTIFLFTSILIYLVLFSSCENTNSGNDTASNLSDQKGWKITLFLEDNTDHTNDFRNYIFEFNVDGSLIASSNNGNKVVGTWNTGIDDSKNKIILNFTNDSFEELNEDWEIIDQTTTKIVLKHLSGGNGGLDFLTFESI